MALDVERVKKDFPILDQLVHGHRLVYLDSASSAQKPTAVLDAMTQLYETTYANVHRGVYAIAEESTRRYEEARSKVAAFIGAASTREVIFTKNVTEAINLVAYSWGRANLAPGDAVLLTEMEHHANLVPWLQLKAERGIEIRYLGIDGNGELILDQLEAQLDGVKLVGLTLVSNVLGTLNPVARIAEAAHAAGALVLVDGAQYTPHFTDPGRRAGLRLLRLHRPQDARPDRYRRPVGPGIVARRHADLPRRRRDDPRRPAGRFHGQRAAVEVRGRHPAHRRGGRAGRRHRLPQRRRDGRHPGPRDRPDQLRPGVVEGTPRRRLHDLRALRSRATAGAC